MSNKVSIDLLADDKAILKALQKVVAGLDKVEARTANLEKTSRRGAKTAETGFEQVRKKLGGMVKEMFGFQTATAAALKAVEALRSEFEKYQRLRREAANAGATAGEAIRQAGVNFQEDSTLKASQLGAELTRISKNTRTSVPIVANAFSAAASAKGDASNRDALNAVEQSLRLLPGNQESAIELASRSLDLQKSSGAKDIRQSLGTLIELQGAARTIDIAKLGSNAPQAIQKSLQTGGTTEFGAEVFAAFTQLAKDAEGRQSSTGTIKLFEGLRAFNPSKDDVDARGEKVGITEGDINAFNNAVGPKQRLQVLQQNERLARSFIKNISLGEAKTQGAAEALVFGTGEGLSALNAADRAISPQGEGLIRKFEDKIATLDTLPFQSPLRAKQQSASNIEGSRLTSSSQRAGVAGEILGQSLDSVNLPGLDVIERAQQLTEYEVQVQRGVAPEQAAINQLKGLQEGGLLGAVSKQDSALLGKQVDLLQSLLDETRRGNGQGSGKKAIELNGRKD